MAVRVVVRQLDVAVAIHGAHSRDRADSCTDLVRERDTLIPRTLGNQGRALRMNRVELVHHERLETVAQWLRGQGETEAYNSKGGANAYVDPSDPLERTDHVRLGERVTSVEHQDERTQTGDGGGRSGTLERCGERTEPGLHRNRVDEREQEEDAVRWVSSYPLVGG